MQKVASAAAEEVQYPSATNVAITTIGLLFTVLCTALDRSIVATAVPRITRDFNSLDDVAWYGSAYLLTMCCFQLLVGKMYGQFDVKWVFLGSLLVFEVGSVVCATAPGSVVLIVGRAIAGIGGAGLISGAMIILSRSVPLHKMPLYTGLVGGASGIAQVVAPTLGGVFTDKVTWRWCFWINLPLGGITFFIVLLFVKIPAVSKTQARGNFKEFVAKFDVMGTLLLMPWIICLLLALQWGGSEYAWKSWRVVLLLVLFAVLFCAWVVVQFRAGDRATLPLRIVKQRSMVAGIAFMFCHFSNFFIVVYYVPIWFQAVRGDSAYQSGINFLTASAAMSVMVILTGILTTKIGYYVPQMIASTIITSVGAGLIYTFDRDTSTGFWIAALIVYGFGLGIGLQQPLIAVQTVFRGADTAIGVSVLIFIQTLASSIFLAVGQNIFQSHLLTELHRIVPDVDPRVVIEAGATQVRAAMAKTYPQDVDGILSAYNGALRQVFLISVVLACLTVVGDASMEWVSVKKDKKAKTSSQSGGDSEKEGVSPESKA